MQPEVLFDDLTCSEQVFDVSFHPSERGVMAVGLIDGKVDLWTCDLVGHSATGAAAGVGHRLMYQNSRHLSSCRGVAFNETGESLSMHRSSSM